MQSSSSGHLMDVFDQPLPALPKDRPTIKETRVKKKSLNMKDIQDLG